MSTFARLNLAALSAPCCSVITILWPSVLVEPGQSWLSSPVFFEFFWCLANLPFSYLVLLTIDIIC